MQHWFISFTPFNTVLCTYVSIYLYISAIFIYNVHLLCGEISSSTAGCIVYGYYLIIVKYLEGTVPP